MWNERKYKINLKLRRNQTGIKETLIGQIKDSWRYYWWGKWNNVGGDYLVYRLIANKNFLA